MTEWKTIKEHGYPEYQGDYIVMNEAFFAYPILVTFYENNFILGSQCNNLPANIPIQVTHYLEIPTK